MELARGFPLSLAPSIDAALMAPLWLVQQPPFCKKRLFAGRKVEIG
jgi:hypothetical protein